MEPEAFNRYLKEDYAKAASFYDRRAKSAKRCYRALAIYLITASALLTVLVSIAPKDTAWRVLGAIVSMSLVVASGLSAHLKCHENWLSYRASWDALERERRLFCTEARDYSVSPDKDALFVERVEAILAREGADFYARHAKGEGHTKQPKTRT